MAITDAESRHISVLAGEGDLPKLRAAVQALALREALCPADVLITCKDDYHQTAAHIAAKGGQARKFPPLPFLSPNVLLMSRRVNRDARRHPRDGGEEVRLLQHAESVQRGQAGAYGDAAWVPRGAEGAGEAWGGSDAAESVWG